MTIPTIPNALTPEGWADRDARTFGVTKDDADEKRDSSTWNESPCAPPANDVA